MGNIKLGEQSVEAVQLLSLLEEGVVLSQALQGQLVRDLDILRLRNISLLELTDLDWVSCTK